MTEAQKLQVVTNGAEHTVPVWPHFLSITGKEPDEISSKEAVPKHETKRGKKTSKLSVSPSNSIERARTDGCSARTLWTLLDEFPESGGTLGHDTLRDFRYVDPPEKSRTVMADLHGTDESMCTEQTHAPTDRLN
jgi:hypothetical protein